MHLIKFISIFSFCALAAFAEEDLFGADTKKAPPEAEVLLRQATDFFADQKFEKAADCYRKAAELGNARAQHNLGSCYMSGTGVKQDMPKAIEWLHKAADQGVEQAYYPLGVCHYQTGAYSKAYAWAPASCRRP